METEPSLKCLKTDIRKAVRRKRGCLDGQQRRLLDASINQHLIDYARRKRPASIAVFMSFDGEPDLLPAMTRMGRKGVSLALPVVQDGAGKSVIIFKHWHSDCEMHKNRYGILEPRGTAQVLVTDLDLVLVPLVAWDGAGNRLGMGASFYDRLFQPFSGLDRPTRMGVGYRIQKVDRVPTDPWDIKLHSMLSEDGCLSFED
jgi:5-formyltetrahydrofolate cyclo-ligase